MLGYAILLTLLVIAIAGWLKTLFKYRQLTAYLALKRIPTPSVEEWEKCARLVLRAMKLRK